MYLNTRGIVFHQTKYSDTSLVVRILTEESGLRSYIIKGARSSKARIRASLFQPLNLLELVASHKEKSDLQHVKEAHLAYSYHSIPEDIRKTSILLFLNELLYKSIQEEAINPELFTFIYEKMILLDNWQANPANFHVAFALHLTHYLGFFPQGKYTGQEMVFDLTEGHMTVTEPLPAENFISGQACSWFSRFLETSVEESDSLAVPALVRAELLEKILVYYHLHLPLTGEFKSHRVLHDVLRQAK